MTKTPVDILLIDDNEGDVELTTIAFEKCERPARISVAYDGAEAVDFLYKRGNHAQASTPHLILLDLNMPKMDGIEFLKVVKQDENFMTIPVIMLTSSSAPSDILISYRRHANCYILKPRGLKEQIEMAKRIENFWFNLVQLPR